MEPTSTRDVTLQVVLRNIGSRRVELAVPSEVGTFHYRWSSVSDGSAGGGACSGAAAPAALTRVTLAPGSTWMRDCELSLEAPGEKATLEVEVVADVVVDGRPAAIRRVLSVGR